MDDGYLVFLTSREERNRGVSLVRRKKRVIIRGLYQIIHQGNLPNIPPVERQSSGVAHISRSWTVRMVTKYCSKLNTAALGIVPTITLRDDERKLPQGLPENGYELLGARRFLPRAQLG